MQTWQLDSGELRLRLMHAATEQERWGHLHGGWQDTDVRPGDPVNIIMDAGSWQTAADGGMHATISDASGLVILHPDILVSGAHRQLWSKFPVIQVQ